MEFQSIEPPFYTSPRRKVFLPCCAASLLFNFPCIFATKRAIRIMVRDTPERIDQIRRLEREVNIKRRRNNPKAKRVSWFYRNGRNYPIDDVVEWATNYEGDAELFAAEDHHKGCMKWGLCDISHPIQNQKDIIADGKNKRKKGSST